MPRLTNATLTRSLTLAMILAAGPSLYGQAVPVSPGTAHDIVATLGPCPTFSWGAVSGATAYELAIFELRDDGRGGDGARAASPQRIRIDAPATVWTPGAQDCLDPGRSYAWAVREAPGLGFPEAEWSEPNLFRVAALDEVAAGGERSPAPDRRDAEDRQQRTASQANGNGGSGVPEVLQELASLRELVQLQHQQLQALVQERTGRLEDQIGVGDVVDPELGGNPSLARRIAALEAGLLPCTPQKLAEGRCDENHPLDLVVTICANVGATAALSATFEVAPGGHFEAGAGWSLGPDVEAVAQIDTPLLLGGVLPVPALGVGASAAGAIGANGCLGGIRIPIGKDLEEELLEVVQQLTEGAEELHRQATNAASRLELGADRIADGLGVLESLQNAEVPIGPLFQDIRGQLESSLPVGTRVTDALGTVEDLAQLIAQNRDCQALIGLGTPGAAEVCAFLENQPDLTEINDAFDALQNLDGQLDAVVDALKPDLEGLSRDIGSLTTDVGEVRTTVLNATNSLYNNLIAALPGIIGDLFP
jgi:hypothetical protein